MQLSELYGKFYNDLHLIRSSLGPRCGSWHGRTSDGVLSEVRRQWRSEDCDTILTRNVRRG